MGERDTKLEQGAVVWAVVPDRNGVMKRRPLVIITDTNQIFMDEKIVGAAITTTYPEPPPETHVALPWHPRGQAATGLRRRSAAVCNWLVRLQPSSVEEVMGFVPTRTLLTIVKRIAQLNAEGDDGT